MIVLRLPFLFFVLMTELLILVLVDLLHKIGDHFLQLRRLLASELDLFFIAVHFFDVPFEFLLVVPFDPLLLLFFTVFASLHLSFAHVLALSCFFEPVAFVMAAVEDEHEIVELVVDTAGIELQSLIVLLRFGHVDWDSGYVLAQPFQLDVELKLVLSREES
jgi:glycopeptide antibiotics resistance protein